eukprot:NODE_5890_length_953_cov_42.403614_g5306_i0.p1 GENE.NODE_5890_length_953_cov_42.403614_g5306_i0~~NODE_5890_length_953_cov_42.403614_g5306_i0.p1  ORF type:complete len:236 (-),score=54.85 NODE_5890_length_953_cov_42.403614_g5306_i0:245-889(-)
MKIVFVLLILCYTHLAFGQCSNYIYGNTCTTVSGCGWCSATQQCLAGNSIGPNVGSCSSWYYYQGCLQHTSRDSCLIDCGGSCGWCDGQCLNGNRDSARGQTCYSWQFNNCGSIESQVVKAISTAVIIGIVSSILGCICCVIIVVAIVYAISRSNRKQTIYTQATYQTPLIQNGKANGGQYNQPPPGYAYGQPGQPAPGGYGQPVGQTAGGCQP